MDTRRNNNNNNYKRNYRNQDYQEEQQYPTENRDRGDNQGPQLKRVSIEPEEDSKRLQRHEIGIKSDLKGSEIKLFVDRAISKLIYENFQKVTLKAIGILYPCLLIFSR